MRRILFSIEALTAAAALVALACGVDPDTQDEASGMGEGSSDGSANSPADGFEGDGDEGPIEGEGHGGGADDDDGDEGEGEGGACGASDYRFTFEWQPPNVMLVLDESGSMLTPWDHDGDEGTPEVTRWHSLHSVVSAVTAGFQDNINFGVKLFPSTEAQGGDSDLACFVDGEPDVAVAAHNAETIIAEIPGADTEEIRGGTPATAGIVNAHTHLRSLGEDVSRGMILVTDGAANCREGEEGWDRGRVYDDNLPVEVAEAFSAFGTPTYVVGINIADELIDEPGNPVINPFNALNDVATAGGVARSGDEGFYNVWSEADLLGALDSIAARIECTFVLDEEPTFPEDVRVVMGEDSLPRVSSCDNDDGWAFTDGLENATAIELCGASCESLQEAHEVEVIYDCPE